jgi:hypothetical protein
MIATKARRADLLGYLFLGAFLMIAYLPVSSFLFALKNDALTVNFPNKFFFSAALKSGHLPIWNPYINFGLPLYADLGFAYWQPITWLFGLIGYSVHVLTLELLFYIWLGGIFMYQLGKYLKHTIIICFCMGVIYMCSGFFIGNFEHINFLTCAAFLPLATRTFLQLNDGFTYKKLFYCILSLYLLATGGHPAIPIGTIYFLAIILIGLTLIKNDKSKQILYSEILKTNTLLLFGFLVVAAPLLYSYYEIIPHLNRAKPVLQAVSLDVGFSAPSYISFLFPFATTTTSMKLFNNSELMRNGYFSFICFAFFLVALVNKKNKIQIIFLIAGGIMLLLSLGDSFKDLIYSHLPLLKFIRTNGEYRIFSIFSFIIVASFPFGKLLTTGLGDGFNKVLFAFMIICLCIILWIITHQSETILFSSASFVQSHSLVNKMKWWIDNLTLSDRLLINAVILLSLLLLYFLLRRKIRLQKLIPAIILADMVLFCWLHLPITGVQKRSANSIENYFSNLPAGIPIPNLTPIKYNRRSDEKLALVIGCWSYYGKQPGTPEWCSYPTLFSTTETYFRSSMIQTINEKPFIFLENDSNSKTPIQIRKFTGNEIQIETSVKKEDALILLQNYYPFWKAQINDQPVAIQIQDNTFMKVPLQSGYNLVDFRFDNKLIPLFIFISLGGLLINIMLIMNKKRVDSNL